MHSAGRCRAGSQGLPSGRIGQSPVGGRVSAALALGVWRCFARSEAANCRSGGALDDCAPADGGGAAGLTWVETRRFMAAGRREGVAWSGGRAVHRLPAGRRQSAAAGRPTDHAICSSAAL